MRPIHCSLPALFLGLMLLATTARVQGQGEAPPPVPDEEGLEYLGRGPVHEGYAQPLEPDAPPSPIAPKAPPEALDENPPDERPEGAGQQWIPGYWQWDDERREFVWVSGFWRQPPPGRKWAPGEHLKTEQGWQRSPGVWAPADQDDAQYYPPPPAAQEETPPAAPSADSTWVPGCWIYQQTAYRWRPGYYVAYRPGWVWTPACYRWTPAGYLFVAGYWDYPLARRGWLYAPVAFRPGYRFAPGYRYRPRYVVSASFLPTALFVRGGWGHYYYGDYYRARGYVPFVDYRVRRHGYDPIYAHYRHRIGPARVQAVHGLYAARIAGRAALPPRTLGQQTIALRGIAPGDARRMTVLGRPGQFSRRPVHRLTPQERARVDRRVVESRQIVRQRRDNEMRLRASPQVRGGPPRSAPLPTFRPSRSSNLKQSARPDKGPPRTMRGNPPGPGVKRVTPRAGRPSVRRPSGPPATPRGGAPLKMDRLRLGGARQAASDTITPS